MTGERRSTVREYESTAARPDIALVPPELAQVFSELVRKYGKPAVTAAAAALERRRERGNATRGEMERIAELILQLPRASAATFNPHAFIQRQITAGIPAAITIEILERVVSVKPQNPWALVNVIMAKDYPHYSWGRK